MPKTNDKFLGKWTLIPELCQYQDGSPPTSGHYEIDLQNGEAQFDIAWKDENGKDHLVHYGGPVDGSVNPLNGGKIEVSFTRVDRHRLDSSTYCGGFEASHVHRKASEDGKLMIVVTTHNHDSDSATRNFQVYRKV